MFCRVRLPKISVEEHMDVCICVNGYNLLTQSFHSHVEWSWLLLTAFCAISTLCSQSLVYCLFFRGLWGCVLHNFLSFSFSWFCVFLQWYAHITVQWVAHWGGNALRSACYSLNLFCMYEGIFPGWYSQCIQNISTWPFSSLSGYLYDIQC